MSETFASKAFPPENRPHLQTPPIPQIRLSQRHIDVLETCPRQFQQIFLDRREPPLSPQQQESMAVGSRFHLLMQQRSIGLSVDSLVEADPQICQWWHDFLAAVPEISASSANDLVFRQAEHERTLKLLDFLLIVRYDFMIADDRAQIFDWKTYPRPRSPKQLKRHWQTRLYPYILAETSDYDPDRISMTYWFVPSAGDGTKPQSYRFPYSQSQHKKNHADLTHLLSQLRDWLSDYQSGQSLPTQQELSGFCSICASRQCQAVPRGDRDVTLEETEWSNIAEIPEIPI
jgi:PD-(D/E)XK nuclease superfamily